MKTAKAAVMDAINEPLRVREYPVPERLAEGELLVRVTMAGICGTDVHLHKGQLPVPLPLVMGHETVAVVEAMGGEVRDWLGQPLKSGDRVSWTVGMTCGECRYCRVYKLPARCVN